MKKHFYSHLVTFESLHVEFDQLELSDEQKERLLELAHSTTHHAVLDVVLSELSEEDKFAFLTLVEENNHEKIWGHLKERIADIEKKIVTTVEELKEQFHHDINEVKGN